jgi:hypothetical protein
MFLWLQAILPMSSEPHQETSPTKKPRLSGARSKLTYVCDRFFVVIRSEAMHYDGIPLPSAEHTQTAPNPLSNSKMPPQPDFSGLDGKVPQPRPALDSRFWSSSHALNSRLATSAIIGISAATAILIFSSSIVLKAN